jgi:hypothetical protein
MESTNQYLDASQSPINLKASEPRRALFRQMTSELLAIANAIPLGMPSLRQPYLADPTKHWDVIHKRILDLTTEFIEFPLAKIAKEVVGGAPGWRRRQALDFARDTAEVARFVAQFDWNGPVEPKRWNYPLVETYETRIEPRYKTGRIFIRQNPLLHLYINLKWWLSEMEATRLRECPVCRHLYYAARSDQPACGTRCAHRLRSRRWYETRGKKRADREGRSA